MNEFYTVDVTIESHPKYKRLERLLDPVDPYGHLCRLYNALGAHYQNGKIPEDMIEDAARWRGQPGAFLQALRDSKMYDADGSVHGWMDRSGLVLALIQEKHELKKEADRKRIQAKREEQRRIAEEEARKVEEADGSRQAGAGNPPASLDVAGCRAASLDVARSRDTETDSETFYPPPASHSSAGDAGAGARDPGLEAHVAMLVAGVRTNLAPRGALATVPDDPELDLWRDVVQRRPRPEWGAWVQRLLSLMLAVAHSKYGRANGADKRFVIATPAQLVEHLAELLVKFPVAADRPASRAGEEFAWVSARRDELELELVRSGHPVTAERSREILAQAEGQWRARAGPAPGSASAGSNGNAAAGSTG